MAKPKKKTTAGNTNNKMKKKTTNRPNNNKQPKQVQESPNTSTIEAAFRRDSQGISCPVCGKRLVHAVYQRHLDKCKISEDDDDIVFCGTVEGTGKNQIKPNLKREFDSPSRSSSITLRESVIVTKKIFGCQQIAASGSSNDELNDEESNSVKTELQNDICLAYSKENDHSQQIAGTSQKELMTMTINEESITSINGTTETELQNICSSKENDDPSSLDALFLSEVYEQILNRLKELLEEHKFEKEPNIDKQKLHENAGKDDEEAEGEKKFVRGIHYTLRFMWKILQHVLLCPEHANSPEIAIKFWSDWPLRTLLVFLRTSVKAQQLFVRLLIRRWGWHIARDIRYPDMGDDPIVLFTELRDNNFLEDAFMSSTISIDEALNLVRLEDFKPLCKVLKVDPHIGRQLIIKEFKKYAAQKNVLGQLNKLNLFKCIKSQIGECYRVRTNILDLFTTFLTIYSPNWMDTSQLIDQPVELGSQLFFTMLQQQTGDLIFLGPTNLPHSLIAIYANHEELMYYIEAKNLEQKLRNLMDKHAYVEMQQLVADMIPIFTKEYLTGENPKINKALIVPVYLRKYTPPWVYCRCIYHGIEAAQRYRAYDVAVEWLTFLLQKEEFKNFCMNFRGTWYHRLALNLDSHLKDNIRSADTCMQGIQDPMIGQKDKLALQTRLEKLSNRLDWSIEGQSPIMLVEPEKVNIVGTILGKSLGDGLVNHFLLPSNSARANSMNTSASKGKDINKCSVEELALCHFLDNEGFTEGVHSEGAIWHTLFRLFFHDIIFCPHLDNANVWISTLQNDPLDLNYSDFYENRRQIIDDRLAQILSSPTVFDHFVAQHFDRIHSNKGMSNSSIGWHPFDSKEQLSRFLKCCSPQLLHGLFKRLCTDFRNTRSGFPDLTLWNAEKSKLAVIEVKGPNDQLSTKQQLWLHFFQSHSVRAAVCHVAAKKDRALE